MPGPFHYRLSRIVVESHFKPATPEPQYTILAQDSYVCVRVTKKQAIEWFIEHLDELAKKEPAP